MSSSEGRSSKSADVSGVCASWASDTGYISFGAFRGRKSCPVAPAQCQSAAQGRTADCPGRERSRGRAGVIMMPAPALWEQLAVL